MYNPQQLKEEFEMVEHGKSRISAIRSAIRMADENHDLMYQLGFRLDLCHESTFYEDSMDMMIVFPEALALVDKYPDIPTTPDKRRFKNGLDRVLQVYKWVIVTCEDYYQISYEDYLRFLEDFKQRSIAFGYNLKPYYKCMRGFYKCIDGELAEQYFQEFRKLPADGNGDCKACDRNYEIEYYLSIDKKDIADDLAKDIENFKLSCGKNNNHAWLRLKTQYLEYYMKRKDYENAMKYVRVLEQHGRKTKLTEFEEWDIFLQCYAHTDIGKALKIYKSNWRDWYEERCPYDKLYQDVRISIFFRELGKARKGNTVKLDLIPDFPLYSENGIYNIQELERFYYESAKDLAIKFDKRNGTDFYQRDLEKMRS